MTDIINQPTQMPPPPPTGPRPLLPPPAPVRSRNPLVTVLIILIALLVAGGLFVGAYLIGANSRDSEVKSAEDATKAVTADLGATETELDDTETELASVQGQLDDAEAALAACDIQEATRIFDDMGGGYIELLDQYGAYLDSDDFLFIVDFDAMKAASHGWKYNGRHTYAQQFAAAVATCGGGDGGTV